MLKMSRPTKIHNTSNYKFEIYSTLYEDDSDDSDDEYNELLEKRRTTRKRRWAMEEKGFKFKAFDLDWLKMCRSKSMETMKFLDQNKLWVNIFAIMNNNSHGAWWLMKRMLKDKRTNLEHIWKLMSSTDTAMSKNLCELYPEHIVWDKISRNTTDWAVEILSKYPEKVNKEIFYMYHQASGSLKRQVNIKYIINKYIEEFKLIKKDIQEKEKREETQRANNPNRIKWELLGKNFIEESTQTLTWKDIKLGNAIR